MLLSLLAACTGPAADDSAAPAACVEESGNICTWAGNGEAAFDGDGNDRLSSSFYWPMNIEFSPYGSPVVLDWNNHRLRIVEDDDTFRTIVGGYFPGDGPDDQGDLTPPGAPGTDVLMNHPTDAKYMPDGTLLIAAWHNHKLRAWDPATGNVMVHCGLTPGFVGDEYEVADDARLNMPNSVVVLDDSTIYFVDQKNERVRELTPDFTINTIAGNGTKGFAGDGGPARDANFSFPSSAQPEPGGAVAVGADGNLYIADSENNRIRKIDMEAGTISTIAGTGDAGWSGDGGPATAAMLNSPRDLEFDADGLLWVADTDNHALRTIDLVTGIIDTVAGAGGEFGFAGDDGPAVDALLYRPYGLDLGTDGNMYVADTYNHRIRVLYR